MNDTTFDALADETRRAVLTDLLVESNPQPDGVGTQDDERTDGHADRAEMYHVHLPKLEACGLIEWHRASSEIVNGPRFDDARPLVEFAAEHTNSEKVTQR
ncbi:transcriptional regulator [Halorientalis pallida]|uniref:Transcriptional regulator n=1 Tax=Halorientalis pallida TaxID=2479928 RepID=A0A498L1C3_9EURY|nr:transcriptional regulator [Halorientalis pallida]RXK51081.1 transcriptional regulator [Halorientalis pallida]